MTIQLPQFGGKSLTWLQFKALCVGNKQQIAKTLSDIGLKGKPFMLKRLLQAQMDSGKGMDLYVKKKQEGGFEEDDD